MRDMKSRLSAAVSIAPAANRTATTEGSGVDLANFDGALVIVQYGTVTDGSWLASIDESDNNSDWTAVAAANLSGSFTTATSSADEATQQVAYIGTKRYIRAVVTESVASSTGALFNAIVVRGNPRKA